MRKLAIVVTIALGSISLFSMVKYKDSYGCSCPHFFVCTYKVRPFSEGGITQDCTFSPSQYVNKEFEVPPGYIPAEIMEKSKSTFYDHCNNSNECIWYYVNDDNLECHGLNFEETCKLKNNEKKCIPLPLDETQKIKELENCDCNINNLCEEN